MVSAIASAPQVTSVPIKDLVVSDLNPRKEKKLDPIELEQLAASIRANGILQPLVVRRAGGKVEVLAGRRRLEAAKLAGLEAVPCVERELDDRAAASAAVVENEQRAQLRPLDSALAVARRLDAGETVEQVAAALGKPATWVARRANLSRLAPKIRKWLEDPSHAMREWSLPVLEHLALLSEDAQLERVKRSEWDSPPSMKEIYRDLAHQCTRLAFAPWDPADAELVPKAGACTVCPYNTANCKDLFGDLVLDEKKADGAVCRRSDCWQEKLKALTERGAKAAIAEHGKGLLRVRAGSDHNLHLDVDETRSEKGVLGDWQYKPVKAGTSGAKPALIVSGKGIGKVIHVMVGEEGRASVSRAKASAEKKPEPGSKEAVKATTERLERRRTAWLVDEAIARMEKTPAPKAELVLKIAGVFGTGGLGFGSTSPGREAAPGALRKAYAAATTAVLWEAVFAGQHGLASQLQLRRQQDLEGSAGVVEMLYELVLGERAWQELTAAAIEAVPAPKALGGLKQTKAKSATKKAKKPAPAKKAGRKA